MSATGATAAAHEITRPAARARRLRQRGRAAESSPRGPDDAAARRRLHRARAARTATVAPRRAPPRRAIRRAPRAPPLHAPPRCASWRSDGGARASAPERKVDTDPALLLLRHVPMSAGAPRRGRRRHRRRRTRGRRGRPVAEATVRRGPARQPARLPPPRRRRAAARRARGRAAAAAGARRRSRSSSRRAGRAPCAAGAKPTRATARSSCARGRCARRTCAPTRTTTRAARAAAAAARSSAAARARARITSRASPAALRCARWRLACRQCARWNILPRARDGGDREQNTHANRRCGGEHERGVGARASRPRADKRAAGRQRGLGKTPRPSPVASDDEDGEFKRRARRGGSRAAPRSLRQGDSGDRPVAPGAPAVPRSTEKDQAPMEERDRARRAAVSQVLQDPDRAARGRRVEPGEPEKGV